MKIIIATLASAATIGLAACTTVTTTQEPASPAASRPPSSPAAPATSTPAQPANPSAVATQQPGPADPTTTVPSVTDPWAVVSAYYGDVESQNYAQAWALLNSGATTGQTYQQFVDGYACTGSQQVEETGESGDQVTFSLAATDTCTGAVQHYTGTDTVQNGKIVAASIHQSG
ncbi:MAG TPA: hypothetical protein VMR00_14565 [Streptosporangiaceae bacterium]|jgi:hypothetical protein|nr:hypothetical protein [Streptosporangiaceae bacterium]